MDLTLAMYGVGALVFFQVVAVIAMRARKPVAVDTGELTTTVGQAQRFAFLSRFLKGRRGQSKIERNLITAGLLIKPTEFLMVNLVVLVLLLLMGTWYAAHMALPEGFASAVKRVFAIFAFGMIGFRGPRLVLDFMAGRRRTKLEYQLVDALAIISSGLKGGYSFAQGLDMAGTQMDVPIKDEFARVMRLIQLGLPTDRALTQMGERINSYDYDMTIGATNIQLAVGGNLSQLLEGIAATIRDRIRLRRDIAALTAQGRISGGILIALPIGIALMLRVVNPEYMAYLTDTPLGNDFLYGALLQQAIGIYWIKKLLDFDS